jgi:uncharacterized cupredoxin-like copper-binding protein
MNRPLVVTIVAVAGAALFGSAVSSGASSVSVTAGKPSEFKFRLSGTAHPGAVTFRVTNRGTTKHDFKIAGKKTKLIAPGKSATLKVSLKKGTVSYLCTVPGHAPSGMKGTITVR